MGVEPIEYFSPLLPVSLCFSVKQLEFQWVERETLAITRIHRFLQFFKTDSETDSCDIIKESKDVLHLCTNSMVKEECDRKAPLFFLCNEKDDAQPY